MKKITKQIITLIVTLSMLSTVFAERCLNEAGVDNNNQNGRWAAASVLLNNANPSAYVAAGYMGPPATVRLTISYTSNSVWYSYYDKTFTNATSVGQNALIPACGNISTIIATVKVSGDITTTSGYCTAFLQTPSN